MRTATFHYLGVLLTISFVSGPAAAQYGGGNGTAAEPYLVTTVAHLKTLTDDSANWDKHFKLMADLDLAAASIHPISMPWVKPFSGVFDGNGHILSHFTYSTSFFDITGLFAVVGPGGVIKNLGLADVLVQQGGIYIGGLAGANWGTITGCFTTGRCTGGQYVGGLVGWNDGTISRCFSTAEASQGARYTGGLVGGNPQGTLIECYAAGPVSRRANDGDVGGLVGYGSNGTVVACFWDTQASGVQRSQGGEGKTTAQMQDIGTFQNVGWDFTSGDDGPTHTWAMPAGGGYPVLWWQTVSSPTLPAFAGGTGDEDDPYLLTTAEQLSALGSSSWLMDRCYRLAADIDLTGVALTPVGSPAGPFVGRFDGDGHQISHWADSRQAGNIAVFAVIGKAGWVENLGVTDVNIAGGDDVAALAARNEGIIQGCFATGCVRGNKRIGGLVAYNVGQVSGCYSEVAVSGKSEVGGLAGTNSGNMEDCYATGAIAAGGGYTGGGFVGGNSGTIIRCYAAGPISDPKAGGLVGDNSGVICNCFWDIDASGRSESAGGKGRHTAAMKQSSTFVGWSGCGASAWTCQEAVDYPRLAWETRRGPALPPLVLADWLPGAGTPADPYLVATAEQFAALGAFPCEWDKSFRLTADLDLSAYSDSEYDRIGLDASRAFTGTFDGAGHRIRNWTCSVDSDNVGLFGYIGPGGDVRRLHLDNCVVAGRVSVGALAGVNRGSLSDCHVVAQVLSAGQDAGLLVGASKNGTIASCSARGNCTGGSSLGGLIGTLYGGKVTACSAEAFVLGDSSLGGLIGDNRGAVTTCRAGGTICGRSRVGGLIGRNFGEASVSNSYSLALVLANDNTGGLIGACAGGGGVSTCYAAGPVVGGGDTAGGLTGGYFASSTTDVAANCFWDIMATGRTTSTGGLGKTTAQMQTASTFLNAGWDFENTWTIREGQDYPRLRWEEVEP